MERYWFIVAALTMGLAIFVLTAGVSVCGTSLSCYFEVPHGPS